MFSTTRRVRLAAVLRVTATIVALVGSWIGLSALILLSTERAEAVTAVFPTLPGKINLPRSVALLDWDGHSGRFMVRDSGFVADLYNAGAVLVLPLRAPGGCLGLREKRPSIKPA